MATRRSQPYRKRSPFRRQGAALQAMTRGRTAFGKNPMDAKRRLTKRHRRRVRRRY